MNRWNQGLRGLLGLLSVCILSACASGSGQSQLTTDDEPLSFEETINWVRADFAQKMTVDLDEISVISAKQVVWANGARGCPKPDQSYTQALVPGYQILVEANEQQAFYHAGLGEAPFWCPDTHRTEPIQTRPSVM